MPIVEAEPKPDARLKGARSLFHICLDRTADMLDKPDSLDIFSTLDWKLQQDLLTHFSNDRRKRQDIERQQSVAKGSVPPIDWEKQIEFDPNKNFIHTHKEDFVTQDGRDFLDWVHDDDAASTSLLVRYWSDFLRSVNLLKSTGVRTKDSIYHENEVLLTENSHDSVIRYSVCHEYFEDGCTHDEPEHLILHQLISGQLLLKRMKTLKNAPGCEYNEDSYEHPDRISLAHGALFVGVDEHDVWCKFWGDVDSVKSAEVYLNALLSRIEEEGPYDEVERRAAFARRYEEVLPTRFLEQGGR
ncbi:uncharacterized protein AB675_11448 [Cyphellophora attinorum]|uniref:Uncharacterized protein n=1 Tax=Cyphellophora attinorum TaxID=1664694 RepID=A0A0N1P119_9EURO|nr:uncharacterized protein AB675_11448 [Phialophora attinorum]KPI39980.1 hypothetical protein AB675_11448 [Phialophora attinorum]